MQNTKPRVISAQKTIQLGQRTKNNWLEHPEFFDGYKLTQADLDIALTRATTAEGAYKAAQSNHEVTKKELKQKLKDNYTKLKAEYAASVQDLDIALEIAAKERAEALRALSRLANGAQFHAKSIALSDEDETNDAAGAAL